MDNLPVKNPFADITAEEVYEAARSQGAIERIFDDFKSCVKNSHSYTTLMEATKQNILGDHFVTMPITDVHSKKKKLQEIAKIAAKFHCSVTEFCAATVEVEGTPIIEKIIKQLSYLKRESASKVVSPSKKGQMHENNNSEDINVRGYDEQQPGTSKKISDADESSFDSKSSAHTSELSSCPVEIEVPTENHGNIRKNPKRSFNSVNKACKSMVEEKKKMPIKRKLVKASSKASVSSKRKGSGETDTMAKRQRKPNLRYNAN